MDQVNHEQGPFAYSNRCIEGRGILQTSRRPGANLPQTLIYCRCVQRGCPSALCARTQLYRRGTLASHRQTRQQIIAYLATHGSIDEASGRASSKLKEAVGYQGSPAAFSQLLGAMERSGEIARTTKGKRT